MNEAKLLDEYASMKMHFDCVLSDDYCTAIECYLQSLLRAEFGDHTLVKVSVDDNLLFVECSMCSFEYIAENAGSISTFIQIGVEYWIKKATEEATANLFSKCISTNVV